MKNGLRRAATATILASGLAISLGALAADNAANSNAPRLSIPLTDSGRLYLREYAPGLLLSVRKQSSPSGASVGWGIEVLRRPITADTPNLLESRTGVMIHAADIASRKVRYPQTMGIAGTPYQLRVDLPKRKVQGKGKDAQFTDGTLEIEWLEK